MTLTISKIREIAVPDMPDDAQAVMRDLLAVHASRWPKNYRRTLYADTEQQFKDLGISLPPQLKRTNYVLGWAKQAVSKPAARTQFAGLKLPGSDDAFELDEVFTANNFALEFTQAVHSAGTHGCAFITVSRGLPGEPAVQIIGHSAEHAAAIWDSRKRRLSAALTISDIDFDGEPSEFTLWLPDANYWVRRDGEKWVSVKTANPSGRVQVVPVPNNPQLNAPLGRSRITNAVMALNDIAARTVARMEGNAEFYSSPQIALLGVDYDSFYGDGGLSRTEKFKMAMERIITITRDENDNMPALQQLQQASMVPHSDMLRTVAMLFSGETGIPPSSLGIIHDNPSSAEAIRANEHDLLIDATLANNTVFSVAVREVATLAVMVRDGLTVPPADSWKISAVFADPEFRSITAEADAVTKLAPVMPIIAEYPVLQERIFTPDQIERNRADARRSSVSSFMQSIRDSAQPTPGAADVLAEGANNATGGQ